MPIKIKAAVVIGAVLSVVATVAAAAGTRSNGPTAPTRSGTTSPTKAGTTCGTESCNPLPYKCGTEPSRRFASYQSPTRPRPSADA
jgi:hypothetical protein